MHGRLSHVTPAHTVIASCIRVYTRGDRKLKDTRVGDTARFTSAVGDGSAAWRRANTKLTKEVEVSKPVTESNQHLPLVGYFYSGHTVVISANQTGRSSRRLTLGSSYTYTVSLHGQRACVDGHAHARANGRSRKRVHDRTRRRMQAPSIRAGTRAYTRTCT